jgi:glycosyltransferase involved in cell wall biosynthesis
MKIILLIPKLAYGGAENVMIDLANKFHDLNYSVEIVAASVGEKNHSELNQEIKTTLLERRKTLFAVFGLSRLVKALKPDVILSTLHSANILNYLATTISGVKTKKVFRTANLGEKLVETPPPISQFIHCIEKKSYLSANQIVALSKEIALELSEKWGVQKNRITRIPNPIHIDRLYAKANLPIDNDLLVAAKSSPLFVTIGRLTKQKNFPALFAALRTAKLPENWHLVIYGEGEQESELRQRAKTLGLSDRITFAGFRANPFPMLQRGIYVQASNYEGCPNGLLQAAVLNRPTIWPRCPGAHVELFAQDNFGIGVDPNAIETFSQVLSHVGSGSIKLNTSYNRDRHNLENIAMAYINVMKKAEM